ncbi:glutamate receptor-like [Diachasma alloeum]|uniref:Ionotropic receptor 112 n=1 Tax=Diachasma alloeum TaxID=454923 RepID=A0A4E0RST8_9HYME|nr:glutamate receptor-like [Diachasma alloeum]THK33007.1 ionotropic receptor 112 [Diachasma alloeum]
MKCWIVLILCFTATQPFPLTNEKGKINYYGSLIDIFYHRYKPSGVIILSPEKDYSFESLTFWHAISNEMSKRGITTAIIDSQSFRDRFTFYTAQSVRPLVVILLGSMEDIYTFGKITMNLYMSDIAWLVLFSGDSDENACSFCHNPFGNLLNLKFNSEVAIACCDSTIIKEWWSIGNNHTRVGQLGRWIDQNRGIQWFSSEALLQRRRSLEGRAFRVCIVKGSNDAWEKDGHFHGPLGKLLEALSEFLNFTISTVIIEDNQGYWDSDISRWTGVIGRLVRGEADIGLAPFMMTAERLKVIDFTVPIYDGFSQLYIKKPDTIVLHWNAYFQVPTISRYFSPTVICLLSQLIIYLQAFHVNIWVVIIGSILIMPLFLTLIIYRKPLFFVPLIFENYLSVWGIYCQQGLPVFPAETPSKILCISIFLSALIVSATYSASLTSFLAVSSSYLPFHTMEEFVEVGTYKLTSIKDSSEYLMFKSSNDTVMQKMWSLMKPKESLPANEEQGFYQVCNEKVAFHLTTGYRKEYLNTATTCKITAIETTRIQGSPLVMPFRSEFTAFFNYYIQRYKHSGLVSRWIEHYHVEQELPRAIYPSVRLEGVIPLLAALAGGFIIALIIFLTERILHRRRDKLRHKKIGKLQLITFQRKQFPRATFHKNLGFRY